MAKRKMIAMYYTRGLHPYLVIGYYTKEIKKGGIEFPVFRSKDRSRTYQIQDVKRWDELTAAQKISVINNEYKSDLENIEFQICKDETLEDCRAEWIASAKRRLHECLYTLTQYYKPELYD